jgi:hypothetical protein
MIVYGSKNKLLRSEIITDKCASCGKQNVIYIDVLQKYAHLFWIPFFPMGKTGQSRCSHCNQVLTLKEMPSSLTSTYQRLKSNTRTPIWVYAGVALFALLIARELVNDKIKKENSVKYILAPKSGDIFEVKKSENQFTLYKVETVTQDSVFFHHCYYETVSETGLDNLKDSSESAYSNWLYSLSKSEIKSMFDKGNIIEVDRK